MSQQSVLDDLRHHLAMYRPCTCTRLLGIVIRQCDLCRTIEAAVKLLKERRDKK